jgi:hypothetical protein
MALLICDATATAPDGKITLYGIFDIIFCRELPLRYAQFSIYWKLFSEESGDISLHIEKPDGTQLLTPEKIKIDEHIQKSQGVYTFGNVEFPVSGPYRIAMVFNDKEIGDTTLLVQTVQS